MSLILFLDTDLEITVSGEFSAALRRRAGIATGRGWPELLLVSCTSSAVVPSRAGQAWLVFQEGLGGDLGRGAQPATTPDLSALMRCLTRGGLGRVGEAAEARPTG